MGECWSACGAIRREAVIRVGAGESARPDTAPEVVRRELLRRWRAALATAALMLGGAAVGVAPPLLIGVLIDQALPSGDIGRAAVLAAGMAGAALLQLALVAGEIYMRVSIGEAVSSRLRELAFDRVLGARIADLAAFSTGQLVFRLTRSCGRVGELYVAERLLPAASHALVLIATAVAMLVVAWQLALLALLVIPLGALVVARVGPLATALDRRFLNLLEAGQVFLEETLGGIRVVRVFGAYAREQRRWREWIRRHWRAKAKMVLLHYLMLDQLAPLAQALVVASVFGVGAALIVDDRLSIGGLVAFAALVPRAYASVRQLLEVLGDRARVRAEYELIDALLQLPPERVGGQRPDRQRRDAGALIQLRNASFDYGRGDAGVRDVSFAAAAGEFVGIVGATGSGKSTILDLLTGLYAPDSGSVRIDGVDTREIDLAWLRAQIGYVPQEPALWAASIASNIRYPTDTVSDDDVHHAATAARLDDFLGRLPDGLETEVGQEGGQLSAGERQRIAIARALLRRPRMLLLDEMTSSLDAITESGLRQSLRESRGDRTMIVVAHRIGTVMDADRILVMDRGRIIESGTPGDLLLAGGTFAAMHGAQAGDLARG